jgi:hypothetical protein
VNTTLAFILGTAGTAAGLYYSFLGIVALKHLPRSTETDRTVGWSLWWWLESARYDAEGKRLCRRGAWVFVFGAMCWLLAMYFSRGKGFA